MTVKTFTVVASLLVHINIYLRMGLCSVLRPRQHSIGYMGDGFYRSKDPTNSIKVLKEATKENNTKNKENTKFTCIDTHMSHMLEDYSAVSNPGLS